MHDDLLLLVAGKSVLRTHALERRLKLVTRLGALTAAAMLIGAVPFYLAVREGRLARAMAARADLAAQDANAARDQAEANEKRARTEAAKSQELAQFFKDMLQSVGPSVALGRDTTLLNEVLNHTLERLGQGLTNQPEVEAELRGTVGRVFQALGKYEQAEAMHRRALALRVGLFGQEIPWRPNPSTN